MSADVCPFIWAVYNIAMSAPPSRLNEKGDVPGIPLHKETCIGEDCAIWDEEACVCSLKSAAISLRGRRCHRRVDNPQIAGVKFPSLGEG